MNKNFLNIGKVVVILLFTFNFQLSTFNSFAQTPQSFQYQAVVRDASGNVLQSTAVAFKLSIILGPLPGTVEYVETHTSITTNTFGVATLAVGNGTPVTNLFSAINWSVSPHYLKVEANLGSGYINMGTTQLLSVPYALFAESSGDSLWSKNGANIYNTNPGNVGVGLNNPTGRMVVQGSLTASDTLPLFEVKNKTGQTIFVVYPDSVHIYVKDIGAKSNQGGFAVSGRNNAKAFTHNYLTVTPDSTRIFTGDSISGFGVENIGAGTTSTSYMHLTPDNYFIGHQAGDSINYGKYNSFFGYQCGVSTTDGNYNVFSGYQSGYLNTLGSYNTFLGFHSGMLNVNGANNVFIGHESGLNNSSGASNVFIGTDAGLNNSTGFVNTFIGQNSGYNNTIGTNNLFIGVESGYNNSTANGNIFLGRQTGYSNLTGYGNLFLGNNAGYMNIDGSNGVYLGYYSGRNSLGNSNVCVGSYTNENNVNGINNTSIGLAAGRESTGSYNLFLGYGSGSGISNTGSHNVFIGYDAGNNDVGSSKLYIENSGNITNPLVNGDFINDRFAINRQADTYPFQVGTNSSNGNGAFLSPGGTWSAGSSRVFKDRFVDLNGQDILNKIAGMELKGWFYKETQEYHIGPFAEDFYQAFGTGMLDVKEDLGRYLSPTDVAGVSIVAVQELIKQIELLKTEVNQLKAIINKTDK